MTEGAILPQLVLFTLPLLLGNIFQMLYNTVDTLVVGNYVSTQALAAVGSTTMVVNIAVFFFNGFSVGASVVIGQEYGAKNLKVLHEAVETTIAMTLIAGVLFTAAGMLTVRPMLLLMATPEDVVRDATVYLQIYFAGISGLLIYNMGSGILRAVGDSRRPLYFLILTSLLNIALDLFFVLKLGMGIGGVAIATILSQFLSAALILLLLSRTKDIYRLSWRDLRLNRNIIRRIFRIGLPAAVSSIITSVSNVFVQSYVNFFGSDCMAGWSCYNKIDTFIYLPMSSMATAATTFVSQNIGAGKTDRVEKGTFQAVGVTVALTAGIAALIFFFAEEASAFFTPSREVISYSALFLRTNVFFLLFNSVCHVLAGALRGRGDSRAPMFCMLGTFVAARQVYLFVMSRFIANTPRAIGFSYPVGWMLCFAAEVTYYLIRYRKKQNQA